MTEQTDRALKEWAVVVRALERGDTVLVLRKGGIVEEGGAFRLQESEFLLFPNYTHQNPTQLQLGYHPLLAETLAERREPDEVTFTSAAEVADAFVVADEEAVARLDPVAAVRGVNQSEAGRSRTNVRTASRSSAMAIPIRRNLRYGMLKIEPGRTLIAVTPLSVRVR